jgi:hypothetical protein
MAEWARGLRKGFKGGQAVIRFVCAGGILLGLEDLKQKLATDPGGASVRAKTEDQLIIALTEIMQLYGAPKDNAWENEFQPETERGECEWPMLSYLTSPTVRPSGCAHSHLAVYGSALTSCILGTHQGPPTLCKSLHIFVR